MTATRSRKEEMYYRSYRKKRSIETLGCQFCAIRKGDDQYVSGHRHFLVIKNIFQYSLWDGQPVQDHLMIIPKQHTDTLGDLSNAASIEFVKLLAVYEGEGYNIYARTPVSSIKSVVHHHTHLIKPVGQTRKFLFFLKRPYIRFVK